MISFLTISYSKVKFLFSDQFGTQYQKFPNNLQGQYESELGWLLKLEESKLDFFKPEAHLEIEEELSKCLKLIKLRDCYLLERVEGNLSIISVLKHNEEGNLELYFAPQDSDFSHISNIIWEDLEFTNKTKVLKVNESILNSMIIDGFFSNKMTLRKVA